MMAPKRKAAVERPPSHTDEAESAERRPSTTDRLGPPEPFEECGPSGGYGGAGTDEAEDDEAEDKD
jgi:hypothetical protein